MSMRDLGLAFKALGRGVYSVCSIIRDIEVHGTNVML